MTDTIKKAINQTVRPRVVLGTVISILLTVAMICNAAFFESQRQAVSDYSACWKDSRGVLVDLDKVVTEDYGGSAVFTRTLPAQLSYDEAICFIAANAVLQVFIDDAQVYAYEQAPNLTGYGYGVAYHLIDLTPEMAGKTVRIELSAAFRDGHGGRIRMISVESPEAYRSRLVKGQLLPFFVSVGIVTIGILLLLSALLLKQWRQKLPLLSLGFFAVFVGIWLVNDTGLLRLVANAVIFSRTVDYVFMHLWVLPLNVFLYSITRERRKDFLGISLMMVVVDAAFFLTMRYTFGTDMAALIPVLVVYYLAEFGLVGWMLYSDSVYCRTNKIAGEKGYFLTGFCILVFSVLVDFSVYLFGVRSVIGRGPFVRAGFCIFFVMMSLQVMKVVSGERTAVRQERFINRMLQFAVSSGDPDVSIRSAIEYLGREFGADHTYIFENRNDGTFHNTYEWFREDAPEPLSTDYHDLPVDGLIEPLYDEFMKEHKLIIETTEQTRQRNPLLYSLMKRVGVSRMVVGPLEVGGELVGLLGVDDAPAEKCEEAARIIWLTSYFVTDLIRQRNEKRDLLRKSYTDSLTGVKNRRSLVEFESEERQIAPYGFVMVDINGLKIENDTHGHEAGDQMIIDVAESLVDAFGSENVYRIGGDEFAAYVPRTERDAFEKMVQRARMLVSSRGRSASFGAVYETEETQSRSAVRDRADGLMYQEKEAYYKGRNDRRSGRR
ncbi:MAG: diguanylate cyclase [Lachnospiraceae bacterium]|nr:diguanylate cyclase [Lachnospiraceae bacterium]